MKYGCACAMRSALDTLMTFEQERYEALLRSARRTPRDDQENLYPSGLLAASGAGRPPQ